MAGWAAAGIAVAVGVGIAAVAAGTAMVISAQINADAARDVAETNARATMQAAREAAEAQKFAAQQDALARMHENDTALLQDKLWYQHELNVMEREASSEQFYAQAQAEIDAIDFYYGEEGLMGTGCEDSYDYGYENGEATV